MEGNKIPILVFDDSSKKRLLKSMGLEKNENLELIDHNKKILTNQEFEPVKEEEFGGILKSSKTVIKKDETELVKFFVDKVDKE